MTELLIEALTKKGKKALLQHIEESKKLSLKNKILFKVSGYSQEVISEEPYTIKLIIKNKWSTQPNFIDLTKQEIIKALRSNRANENKDYKINWSA